MKTLKEFIGTTGVRVGGYSNVQPIASLGDTPPKKRPGGKNARGVGLHAGYTGALNQHPFNSADPKVEPKKKKENYMDPGISVDPKVEPKKKAKKEFYMDPRPTANPHREPKNKPKKESTLGGMVHVRGAQATASLSTRNRKK